MLQDDDVIFDRKPFRQADDKIRLTFGEIASSDEVLQTVLFHGIKRIMDSIRDSEKDPKKDVFAQQCERADKIRRGELWSHRGGGSIPTEEYIRRDELAGWIMRWLGYSKADAEKLARKTGTALGAVAGAIYHHRHGSEPDSATLAEAANKVGSKVEQQVAERMKAQAQPDIDI